MINDSYESSIELTRNAPVRIALLESDSSKRADGSTGMTARRTHLTRRLAQLGQSKFVRDAISLLVLNVLSKGLAFFGAAHAAACLGPTNLGISALVQSTAQQASLTFNGGFDNVAVRRIAAKPGEAACATPIILLFRLPAALALACIWLILVNMLAPETQRFAWRLGAIVLLSTAANISFAFQGLERLPIQNAIGTASSALTAAAYLLAFSPGMPLGSDLVVIAGAGLLTVLASWTAFHKVSGSWPLARVARSSLISLRALVAESRPYWVLVAVTYLYSTFQVPLIAYYLGVKEAGVFRSAFVLMSGVELFFNSANSLLLARLVTWRAMSFQTMWCRQRQLVALWCAFGIPIVLALIVFAPFIYRVFLGPQFAGAVSVFRLLVLSRLITFVGQIYAWGLVAAGRDREFMLSASLGALSSLVVNSALLPAVGIISCGIASLISEALVVASCFFMLQRHGRAFGCLPQSIMR